MGTSENLSEMSADRTGHVDIILRRGNGRLVRVIAVDYLARSIPPSVHGSIGRSQSSAYFSEMPSELASIIVRYHEGEKSDCGYAGLVELEARNERNPVP